MGASVLSNAGSRGVRISLSNAGYTIFGGGVRVLATHSIRQFPLHFPVRHRLPLGSERALPLFLLWAFAACSRVNFSSTVFNRPNIFVAANGIRTRRGKFRFQAVGKTVSVLRPVQTASEAHPSSYRIFTRDSFPSLCGPAINMATHLHVKQKI